MEVLTGRFGLDSEVIVRLDVVEHLLAHRAVPGSGNSSAVQQCVGALDARVSRPACDDAGAAKVVDDDGLCTVNNMWTRSCTSVPGKVFRDFHLPVLKFMRKRLAPTARTSL